MCLQLTGVNRTSNQYGTEGYDPQASLDGVGEQEASWRVDLVILLLDVLCNLPQHLQKQSEHRRGNIITGVKPVGDTRQNLNTSRT